MWAKSSRKKTVKRDVNSVEQNYWGKKNKKSSKDYQSS
jgi:hypothetical protein